MSVIAFETEDGAVPLRRSTRHRRGMRTGPLRALHPRRASSLPLALIAMLAAAGSAAAVITTQPKPSPASEALAAEWAGLEPASADAVRDEPAAAPAPETPVAALREDTRAQMSAPVLDLAPAPQPVEPVPAPAATSLFGPDSLPVLEADETSLGIDEALDALSAPITPQAKPSPRRNTATVAGRSAN